MIRLMHIINFDYTMICFSSILKPLVLLCMIIINLNN